MTGVSSGHSCPVNNVAYSATYARENQACVRILARAGAVIGLGICCSIQNFVIVGEDEEGMQGAYLYYDTNDEKWIRSGKVTGSSFLDRHKDHKKKASQSEATSRFYLRYPSVTKSNDMSYSRRGYFDNIKQCVALGLDNINNVPNSFTSDVNNGGIFAFT